MLSQLGPDMSCGQSVLNLSGGSGFVCFGLGLRFGSRFGSVDCAFGLQ